jgi:hypothetical protein
MTGTAAYGKKIKVSDGANWLELPQADGNLDLEAAELDDTSSLDAGVRSRIMGLLDSGLSVTCEYMITGGALNTALATVRSQFLARATTYFQYLPSGVLADGFDIPCKILNYKQAGGVDGKEVVSFELKGDGAVTAAASDPPA